MTLMLWLAVLVLYGYGVVARRRQGRGGGGIGLYNVASFATGWWALTLAIAPPLDTLAERYVSAHMTQHLVFVVVAAPLLALGRPALALAAVLPRAPRRGVMRIATRLGAMTLPAWAVHTLVLWGWHVPTFYDRAVAHEALHAFEHATMLGSALWFWATLVDTARRRRLGVAAAWVFATGLHCTLLGMLITVAPRPWYARPDALASAPALGTLEDQQLAGLILWVPGGVILAAAGLALVAAWLHEAGRRVVTTRVERARPLIAIAAIALCATTLIGCDSTRLRAARMTGGDPTHGRQALRAYGCWTCHTIPGVPGANGTVGPSLAGLAGRAFIAGRPNTPDSLVTWIQHPSAVRSSTPMPELGVTERDSRDIAAYLYTLR